MSLEGSARLGRREAEGRIGAVAAAGTSALEEAVLFAVAAEQTTAFGLEAAGLRLFGLRPAEPTPAATSCWRLRRRALPEMETRSIQAASASLGVQPLE